MKASEIFETPEASGFDRVNTHQQPSKKWSKEKAIHDIEMLYLGVPDLSGELRDDAKAILDNLLTSHSQAIRERVKAKLQKGYFAHSYKAVGRQGRFISKDDILALLTDGKNI